MQGLARARERSPAQEQWRTMKITMWVSMGKTMRRGGHPRRQQVRLRYRRPATAALEKQSAPEAAWPRTRECHSALNAMRRLRRERKRDSIYPRCSASLLHCPPSVSRSPDGPSRKRGVIRGRLLRDSAFPAFRFASCGLPPEASNLHQLVREVLRLHGARGARVVLGQNRAAALHRADEAV